METKVLNGFDENGELNQAAIKEAGELIRQGGLVAFPTETVYGLGGDALNPESSKKIYAAKGRPSDNPLIVHIADMESLPLIVETIPEEALVLASCFWPGPLTMILAKSGIVPKETTGGLETVAIRMPSHPIALALIREAGGYIAAPSANRSGRPSPTLASHVLEDLNGKIGIILDGGHAAIGLESTIIDLTVSPPALLRPGYITEDEIWEALRDNGTRKSVQKEYGSIFSGKSHPKAPGMKYRHYAPRGDVYLIGVNSQVLEKSGNSEKLENLEKQKNIRKSKNKNETNSLNSEEKNNNASKTAEIKRDIIENLFCMAEKAQGEGKRVGLLISTELLDEIQKEGSDQQKAVLKDCFIFSLGSRERPEEIAESLFEGLRKMDEENCECILAEAFPEKGLFLAVMNRLKKAAAKRAGF
ncbi:MAG: threonylcarbamoyl-AMP synthase [Lachnospiraceae bacterium]|nr:threonylcarbamoyl-AMP synthase [Lachnospiraceae bacterium]